MVRAIREKSGLTQEQLAHRLKVSFSTVNGWENGRHRPQRYLRDELEKLAAELEIASGSTAQRTGRATR